MKVVILAGGMGTRLMEETQLRPKPMVEIGGKPILWHIMKHYQYYGYNEFIICLGYKGEMIKEYFLNYKKYNSTLQINVKTNKVDFLDQVDDDFDVTLVDTGLHTNTAGRIQKIKKYLDGKPFLMTYGDGISNVNIHQLVLHHKQNTSIATLTSVNPGNTFGIIKSNEEGLVESFSEKIELDLKINAGFFVLEQEIFDYIEESSDHIQWEKGPLRQIAIDGKLSTYFHNGFWKCMDALRDKVELENLWNTSPKWKVW